MSEEDLLKLAWAYFEAFLPYFVDQPEGSIEARRVTIAFTARMRQKLALAYLFEHRIRLNRVYFAKDPSLLPYTLFHEMTHIWLYDCHLDPGHTRRFYNKMKQFEQTGLPKDPEVYIHTRVASEARYVYSCPNCKNRWYVKEQLGYTMFCGHCFDREGVEYFAQPTSSPNNISLVPAVAPSSAA